MNQDKLTEEYQKRRPKSALLHERALKLFAADGATHSSCVMNPFRPYITDARGVKKWDVDGLEYIDYVMGHGALLFGHSHPSLVKAVREQVVKGVHFGDNHELEIVWAELIKSMLPSAEKVEFFSCGQEANMMALRLARVFTGRKKTLRFMENFHGWSDGLVLPPTLPGVLAEEVKLIPYDLAVVEKELSTGEYAILMTEGGGAHMSGQVPLEPDFIRSLPAIAHKYGTVWLLDEVVTGFRDAPGGYQGIVGVKPDITSLGKIIGGGLPVGALTGREDIFHALSPEAPPDKRVIHTGTWNANPLAAAAGIATLKMCQDGKPQKEANDMAAYLRLKGNKLFKDLQVQGYLYGRSITHIYFGPWDYEPSDDRTPPTKDMAKIMGSGALNARLNLHLLHRGVSTLGGRMFILSCVHTRQDIDKTLAAFAESLQAMLDEGTLNKSVK